MERYAGEEVCCVKCGADDPATEYCDGKIRYEPTEGYHSCRWGNYEHLHRICKNCGYKWPEGCINQINE